MAGIIVRRALRADAPILGTFASRLDRDISEYRRSTRIDPVIFAVGIRDGIDHADPVLIAEVSGAPIGSLVWIRATPGPSVPKNCLAAMGTYVLPEWRKKGVSKLLREAAFEIARKKRYECIIGTCHTQNAAGVASLKGQGWVEEYTVFFKEI